MQSSGPITIDTTLGPGAVTFRSMVGREALRQPFLFDVEVLSQRADLKPSELLGQPASVHLETAGFGARHFTGLVSRLELLGASDTYTAYRLVLRPWLWLLKRNVNSRVFQGLNVP